MDKLENKLLTSFLAQDENQQLYCLYQRNPSPTIKHLLDHRFRIHYLRFRAISYFIKVLHFESKHFDRKMRKHNKVYQLPTDEYEFEQLVNNFSNDTTNNSFNGESQDIVDHITDEYLIKRISKLTEKHKKILTLIYVQQMTDTEVAKHLGLTQQYVSRTKKIIIEKLAVGGRM